PWWSTICVDPAGDCTHQRGLSLGPTHSAGCRLLRELGAEDLCFLDGGRRGQQFGGDLHECFGNRAVEVSLPSRLIGKRVEYGERRSAQAQREPQFGGRFLIRQLKTLRQEGGDFILRPRFRLQSNKQSN